MILVFHVKAGFRASCQDGELMVIDFVKSSPGFLRSSNTYPD